MDISLTSDKGFEDLKIISEQLQVEQLRKTRTFGELERKLKKILGNHISFKKDYYDNSLNLTGRDNLDIPYNREVISYIITITTNSLTQQIYFNIEPKVLKLDVGENFDDYESQRLIKAFKQHKKTVLDVDCKLRRFAREYYFEYETNHTFPIPEDKNQLKLEYTVSQ